MRRRKKVTQQKDNQKHDETYKKLFSHHKMFLQLLGFMKEKWIDKIDVDSLQKINNSFILSDFSKREADLIYLVNTKDGKNDIYLYVLIEMQSSQLCPKYTYINAFLVIWLSTAKN